MLSNKEKKKIGMKEGKWYCAKCNVEIKKSILDSYEYIEGIPLHDVECLRCPKCNQISFTDRQADKMEKRTEKLKGQMFFFVRKIGYSGKSLTITIPESLASHLKVKKGQKVKIRPLNKKGFMVEVK